MRRSRLHRSPVWPLFVVLTLGLMLLGAGLTFHPRQTGFIGFVGVLAAWLCNVAALTVAVIRAKRRAARGIVDMTNEPDPAKGEFA